MSVFAAIGIYFANTLLVCAANNVPGPSYPSLFAAVLSVAAHDVADPEVWYYNPAPPVEFGAYGVDVDVAAAAHAQQRGLGVQILVVRHAVADVEAGAHFAEVGGFVSENFADRNKSARHSTFFSSLFNSSRGNGSRMGA